MADITWKITQLDRRSADGFVTTAHWTCSGISGEYAASVYSTVSFEGEPAVPYENLTESDVIAWVWETVDKNVTEQTIVDNIEAQKNPVSLSGLPW